VTPFLASDGGKKSATAVHLCKSDKPLRRNDLAPKLRFEIFLGIQSVELVSTASDEWSVFGDEAHVKWCRITPKTKRDALEITNMADRRPASRDSRRGTSALAVAWPSALILAARIGTVQGR
jgi:hypothetical protein